MHQQLPPSRTWISAELVRKAWAGDEDARQMLLTQSAEIIHAAIYKAFGRRPPEDELEDLAQDIYTKILRTAHGAQKSRGLPALALPTGH